MNMVLELSASGPWVRLGAKDAFASTWPKSMNSGKSGPAPQPWLISDPGVLAHTQTYIGKVLWCANAG